MYSKALDDIRTAVHQLVAEDDEHDDKTKQIGKLIFDSVFEVVDQLLYDIHRIADAQEVLARASVDTELAIKKGLDEGKLQM